MNTISIVSKEQCGMNEGTMEEEKRENELNENISVVPVKLTNSQVLQNLDHKLTHL